MDDIDISFDFESNLSAAPAASLPSTEPGAGGMPGNAVAVMPGNAQGSEVSRPGDGRPMFQQYVSKKNYRQTVCRHWLRGLCMKGDQCGFLHQFDQNRMPVCRFFARFGVCREPECVFKHSTEEVKECNMFNLGFCIHGPLCRYKHVRLSGPPPPPDMVEAAKPREYRNSRVAAASNSNKIRQDQMRAAGEGADPSALAPPPQNLALPAPTPQGGHQNNGGLPADRCVPIPASSGAAPSASAQPAQSGSADQAVGGEASGSKRFFVVHLSDAREFNQARVSSQWTPSLASKTTLSEVFPTIQNVILVFTDVRAQMVCGCARMQGISGQGRPVPIKWLGAAPMKAVHFQGIANKLNENRPLIQTRDGQELDQDAGTAAINLLTDAVGNPTPAPTPEPTPAPTPAPSAAPATTPSPVAPPVQPIAPSTVKVEDRKRPHSPAALPMDDRPRDAAHAGPPPAAPVAPAPPILSGTSRFFVMHMKDEREFVQAKNSKQWAASLAHRVKLNEAFATVDNVILVFVDVRAGMVCGCARMEGTAKQARAMMMRKPGMAAGAIPIRWLGSAPMKAIHFEGIKNKRNENRPLIQTRDGQELDADAGMGAVKMLAEEGGRRQERERKRGRFDR